MEKPEYATQDMYDFTIAKENLPSNCFMNGVFSFICRYDIMLSCWHSQPELRPLFDSLDLSFRGMLENSITEYYITLDELHLTSHVPKGYEIDSSGQADYEPPTNKCEELT